MSRHLGHSGVIWGYKMLFPDPGLSARRKQNMDEIILQIQSSILEFTGPNQILKFISIVYLNENWKIDCSEQSFYWSWAGGPVLVLMTPNIVMHLLKWTHVYHLKISFFSDSTKVSNVCCVIITIDRFRGRGATFLNQVIGCMYLQNISNFILVIFLLPCFVIFTLKFNSVSFNYNYWIKTNCFETAPLWECLDSPLITVFYCENLKVIILFSTFINSI